MADIESKAYLKTRVMTASPAELRLMLFDGALRFADRARTALERADHEGSYENITRCQDIVMELLNALRPEYDRELCERMAALYTFIYTRLVEALRAKSVDIMDEVISLLEYERETWKLLMDRVQEENAAAANVRSVPAASDDACSRSDTPPIVGGSISVEG